MKNYSATFFLFSRTDADCPIMPNGIVNGVAHYASEDGDEEHFIAVRFDTKTGALQIGNRKNVVDTMSTIKEIIQEYNEKGGHHLAPVVSDFEEDKWHIVSAVRVDDDETPLVN